MARTDSTPENHHVVPKNALLNQFADDGKVFIYDRLSNRVIPQATSVNNVLARRDFYSFKTDTELVSIEQGLTDLEDEFAPINSQIVEDCSLAGITDEQRQIVSTFVAAQYLRSPKHRSSYSDMAKTLAEKAEQIAPKASNLREIKKGASDELVKLETIKMIESGTEKIAKQLFSYRWILHSAPKGSSFWISDCPVVMHNEENFGPYGNIGFSVPNIQISMPLAPHLLLSILHPKIITNITSADSDIQQNIKDIRLKTLFGINRNTVEFQKLLAELEESILSTSEFLASLDCGAARALSKDNIIHYNALQFDWCSRFIASRYRDFELAHEMHSKEPDRGVSLNFD